MGGPSFGPFSWNFVLFWLFSGVGLALWQKVDLATLRQNTYYRKLK